MCVCVCVFPVYTTNTLCVMQNRTQHNTTGYSGRIYPKAVKGRWDQLSEPSVDQTGPVETCRNISSFESEEIHCETTKLNTQLQVFH